MRTALRTRLGGDGFTLLEVIIAIAIIGIMIGAIAPVAHRQLVAAREDATRQELDRLRAALAAYYEDVGGFPGEGVGLAALVGTTGPAGWQGPYLEAGGEDPAAAVATDAFGQALRLRPRAQRAAGRRRGSHRGQLRRQPPPRSVRGRHLESRRCRRGGRHRARHRDRPSQSREAPEFAGRAG